MRLDVNLHRKELHQHSATVVAILQAAREVARVGVVTLATREWVASSSRRLFPGLDVNALFNELGIQVYCAVAAKGSRTVSGVDPYVVAKKKAMSKCLQQMYRFKSSQLCWNVTSIGDSSVEQHALKELLKEHSRNTLCKTVKLAGEPTLERLTCQLESLVPHFSRVVSHSKDFDWTSSSLLIGR